MYKRFMPEKVFLQIVSIRIKAVFILFSILFFMMIAFYWKTQVKKHDYYLEKSQNNILRVERIPSPRGVIVSSDGKIVVDNKVSYNVFLDINKLSLSEFNLKRISSYLGISFDTVKKRSKKNYYLGRALIAEDIEFKKASRLFSERQKICGLRLKVFPKREYPFGNILSHITGYVGEVTIDELRRSNKYEMGDYVGRNGIERYYDSLLMGKKGTLYHIVNSRGKTVRVVKRKPPSSGAELHITINVELQKMILNELKKRNQSGSIVVMEPYSGKVLSLISYPDYDPNIFLTPKRSSEVKKLLNVKESPLLNKTITGLYSPGSIFKLLVGIAALNEGVITPNDTVFCSGFKEFYGKIFHCWNTGGHGNVNIYQAIEKSCNIFFYTVGKELGIDKIYEYSKKFGFGAPTGIDLPYEKKGVVPSREWKRRVFGVDWFPGETISVAIGQGPLLVTPVQVASFISIIATRGYVVKPHLLDYFIDASGRRYSYRSQIHKLDIRESIFSAIIEGMWRVVNEDGTGKLARIDGVDICGKTGTVQIVSKETLEIRVKNEKEKKWTTHAWFAGFAPKESPKIVVVVLLEHSGAGGEVAAPFARFIFKTYFDMIKRN